MNEQQWEEIKIEDVQPGDVARCNGHEWQVVETIWPCGWVTKAEGRSSYPPIQCRELGFTFHRKVKREPLSTTAVVDLFEHQLHAGVPLPSDWAGRKVRITEILDGEDGA